MTIDQVGQVDFAAVFEDNGMPFYLRRDGDGESWTIFLRGEDFPAVIDGWIMDFGVASDMVNRYNRCVEWYIRRRDGMRLRGWTK